MNKIASLLVLDSRKFLRKSSPMEMVVFGLKVCYVLYFTVFIITFKDELQDFLLSEKSNSIFFFLLTDVSIRFFFLPDIFSFIGIYQTTIFSKKALFNYATIRRFFGFYTLVSALFLYLIFGFPFWLSIVLLVFLECLFDISIWLYALFGIGTWWWFYQFSTLFFSTIFLYALLSFLAIILYYIRYKRLKRTFYCQNTFVVYEKKLPSFTTQFLKNTVINNLIILNLKQIKRNKRVFEYFSVGVVLFFVFLYIFFANDKQFTSLQIYGLLIVLNALVVSNYQLLLFNWDSSIFNFLQTSGITIHQYLVSKRLFFTYGCLISCLLLLPLSLMSSHFLLVIILAFIFNITVSNNAIILFTILFNDDKINLSKSTFFNYEGVNTSQILIILVPFLVLIILQGLTSFFDVLYGIEIGTCLIAVILLLTQRYLDKFYVKLFTKLKYTKIKRFTT